ncbi:MAG TPA: phage major capsid protein, partial [Actinomycetota bacterium]|nr:phage major capsid protein [Actinomycetota bacterium]
KIAQAIERKEKMADAIAKAPISPQPKGEERVRVGTEPLTYRRTNEGGMYSFFSDAYFASKHGDPSAQARLARHTREMQALGAEARAMTTAGGSGVGIVPPLYLQDMIATFARAGRPFADALGGRPLPDTGVSFNIPRVTTGSTAAIVAEGNAVNDTSPVTDDITLALNTVAGKVDMSRQLAERSTPAADEIIGQDLAADIAKQLDTQLLNQATNGLRNVSGASTVTFTTPVTVAGFYPKLADAIQRVHTLRFMPPDLIVMHPRRWGWILAALDTQSRPLVVPDAGAARQAFNPVAGQNGVVPQGLVGTMQGLPVLTDPNIVTNLGAATNQDQVYVIRKEDHPLYESGTPTIRVYEEVLSANLQVRVLAYEYFAFTFARYAAGVSIIDGAGLVAPTF